MIKTLSRIVQLVRGARSAVEFGANPAPILDGVVAELWAAHSDHELRDLLLVLRVAGAHAEAQWAEGEAPAAPRDMGPELRHFAADIKRARHIRPARKALPKRDRWAPRVRRGVVRHG